MLLGDYIYYVYDGGVWGRKLDRVCLIINGVKNNIFLCWFLFFCSCE